MSGNYLTQAINGAVRTAVVLYPALKASQHLLEGARRALNVALGLISIEIKLPEVVKEPNNKDLWDKAPFQSKAYTYIHDYLPKSVTEQNDAFRGLNNKDLAKGFLMYTAITVVGTFVANKFIGQIPPVYNTISQFAGSPIRIDRDYDLIQMGFNYITGK